MFHGIKNPNMVSPYMSEIIAFFLRLQVSEKNHSHAHTEHAKLKFIIR